MGNSKKIYQLNLLPLSFDHTKHDKKFKKINDQETNKDISNQMKYSGAPTRHTKFAPALPAIPIAYA